MWLSSPCLPRCTEYSRWRFPLSSRLCPRTSPSPSRAHVLVCAMLHTGLDALAHVCYLSSSPHPPTPTLHEVRVEHARSSRCPFVPVYYMRIPYSSLQFLPSLFESEARSSHSDSKSEGLEVCSNVWYISLERGGVRVERLVFGPNMEDLRALRDQ